MASPAFRIVRVTLVAGVVTPIIPPMSSAHRVMISAATTDVTVATEATALVNYRTILTGFEREFRLERYYFSSDATAFWLLSAAGGLVILEWF